MDFEDALEDIASRIGDYGNTLDTEEATKNAIIMPFMSKVLGYDVFDPTQVTPEFTTDVGTKKGEKIDYAIRRNGEVQVLIECKRIDEPSVSTMHHNCSDIFTYQAHESEFSRMERRGSSSPIWMSRTRWTRSHSCCLTSPTLIPTFSQS